MSTDVQIAGLAALKVLEPVARPSVTDSVFDVLHRQILGLDLVPGTKLSEAEVSRALGVSRQPVRDAFYRLSRLGLLSIRPQRATTVSHISSEAVLRARFIRTAIEVETVRAACERLTDADLQALEAILDDQARAVAALDPLAFQALDDRFHAEICARSGHAYAWDIIGEIKTQMDRVRFLSLAFASHQALDDHRLVLQGLRAGDAGAATAAMRLHLSRIGDQIQRIRAENAAYFEGENQP